MALSNESSFIYYVMSDSSRLIHPDNKPQNFRNVVPHHLYLDGEWEIGVVAMLYRHNWDQLRFDSYLTVYLPTMTRTLRYGKLCQTIRVNIQSRQFKSVEDLVDRLNQTINTAIDRHFASDMLLERFALKDVHKYRDCEFELTSSYPRRLSLKDYGYGFGYRILLPPRTDPARELWRILGFEDSVTELLEGSVARYAVDLNLNLSALMVYSQVVEYIGVGDTRAPLLAIVPISGTQGENVYVRFDRPTYVKIMQRYLSEIDITILNDIGDEVQFGRGRVILVLHFRRRF